MQKWTYRIGMQSKSLYKKVDYLPKTTKAYFTCGTHFGETKLVASTIGNPEETSILISSTFTTVGTMSFSFCNPSLGPTSTIFTNPGILLSNCKTSCKLLDYTIPVFKIENHQTLRLAYMSRKIWKNVVYIIEIVSLWTCVNTHSQNITDVSYISMKLQIWLKIKSLKNLIHWAMTQTMTLQIKKRNRQSL